MSLYEKIIALYPELADYDFADGDIRIQNDSDGKGDYIKEWNLKIKLQGWLAKAHAMVWEYVVFL